MTLRVDGLIERVRLLATHHRHNWACSMIGKTYVELDVTDRDALLAIVEAAKRWKEARDTFRDRGDACPIRDCEYCRENEEDLREAEAALSALLAEEESDG